MKVGFISLGCSKNLIDTEATIGMFKKNRYKLLDMKNEIANYGKERSSLDKVTYDKLVRGIDRLNEILK